MYFPSSLYNTGNSVYEYKCISCIYVIHGSIELDDLRGHGVGEHVSYIWNLYVTSVHGSRTYVCDDVE